MSRMTVPEALKVCKDFSQFKPRFSGKGPAVRIKKLEHAAGYPIMRRQRIFNDAVVLVLEQVVRSTERADELVTGHLEQTAHHEGIAALRRDLIALQQEVSALRKELAGA